VKLLCTLIEVGHDVTFLDLEDRKVVHRKVDENELVDLQRFPCQRIVGLDLETMVLVGDFGEFVDGFDFEESYAVTCRLDSIDNAHDGEVLELFEEFDLVHVEELVEPRVEGTTTV